MKHLSMSRLLRIVAACSLIFLTSAGNAQTIMAPQYVATSANSGGYYEYLPSSYGNGANYPLLIFLQGIGELGDGSASQLPKIAWVGLPAVINGGRFPSSFNVNGQTFSYIVLAPQFKNWPSPADVNAVIDYAIKTYHVDQSRIYVTGLSMGGGVTWQVAGTYSSRIAAIVPISGAAGPDPTQAQNIANAKIGAWGTHNLYDPTVASSNTVGWVDQINADGGIAKKTIFNTSGHDAWDATYDPNYRENNMNVYEWMLQFKKGGTTPTVSPTPTPTPTPTPVSTVTTTLPAKIEAENWNAMSGVATENAWGDPLGGGLDVGWIDPNDWMDYSVNAPSAGTYTVNLRVASAANGAQVQIRKADGTVLTTVGVPNTGGWQTWQTISTTVTLPAGTQTLRVVSTSSAGSVLNLNWLEFVQASSAIPVPSTPTTTTGSATRIEAENWSTMSGVATENAWGDPNGGGLDVGWIDPNDWMDYGFNAPTSGTYTVNFRVASAANGAQFQLKKSDGTVLTTVNVPNTGGWQTWQTISATVTLPAGQQTIRLFCTSTPGSVFNINWLELAASGASGTTTPTTSTTSSTATRIQTEYWNAMSGVATENAWGDPTGGGLDVGWIDPNDWMDYGFNAPTSGTYTVNFRIASAANGAQFQLRKADGTVLTTVNVPNTGGWQTWQTISATVTLPAGQQTIRLFCTSTAGSVFNINWLEFAASGTTTTPAPATGSTTTIQAENWAAMSGVATENAWGDPTGGGLDVGWIDPNDWMDYGFNAPVAGTYTVNFRIASAANGAQFQLRKADGTVLTTVNVPNTGGWQTWQTISATVTLAAGQQTIRLFSTSGWGGVFNINWLQFVSGSSLTATAQRSTSIMSTDTTAATSAALDVFPNPVTDRFALQVNNNLTGTMTVQIVDMQGALQKQFSLSKTATGSSQFYLSIGDLAAGNYIVKATMTNWTQSKQIVKQ